VIEQKLGELMVRERLMSQERLDQALQIQATTGGTLDSTLLEMGVEENAVLAALGRVHRTRTATAADLSAAQPELARMISPRVAQRYEVVPFRLEGKKLSVAFLTPGDIMAEDEISLVTGCMVVPHVALEVRIYEALARLYRAQRPARLVSISKRLAAGKKVPTQPAPTPEPAVEVPTALPDELFTAEIPEPPVSPLVDETAPAPETETVPAPPQPPARKVVSELEISEEDLALFPSLLATEPADSEAEVLPAPATAAEVSEETEVTEVRAEPLQELLQEDETDPELRLAMAAVELLNAEMREDIADTLLAYCTPYLRRRALLYLRKDHVIGWRAEGQEVDQKALREVSIPTA
jgi:hypothetical protein